MKQEVVFPGQNEELEEKGLIFVVANAQTPRTLSLTNGTFATAY